MSEEKYGFVYIWYDCAKHKQHKEKYTKRFYIGCHWGREDDGYICSSNWMRDAYRKRSQDFKRRILSRIYTTRQDLSEEEYKWLFLIKKEELGKKYYNFRNRRSGHSDESIKKNIGNHRSEETREKLSISHLGQHNSPDTEFTKGHMPWNTGKEWSDEIKEKMSIAKKGKSSKRKGCKLSDEHKEKIGRASKGRKFSEESIRKRSETVRNNKKNGKLRKPFTDETRKNISNSAKEAWKRRKCGE